MHELFVIAGRKDVPGCNIAQPTFCCGDPPHGPGWKSEHHLPDPDTCLWRGADRSNSRLGSFLRNKSLLMFAGEAYNVEMGISNQLFPQERDETPGCLFNATPEDRLNFHNDSPTLGNSNAAVLSDIEAFANFMWMLAPPTPAPATPSSESGRSTFAKMGWPNFIHPHLLLPTGNMIASGSSTIPSAALSHQTANLFSDLLVHHMGEGLADGISQGSAGPDEFRTAPLWGVGQRVFFLHDGRTTDLVEAIRSHRSRGSEANKVIFPAMVSVYCCAANEPMPYPSRMKGAFEFSFLAMPLSRAMSSTSKSKPPVPKSPRCARDWRCDRVHDGHFHRLSDQLIQGRQ